ncbi:PAAR domain-containing protein [Vannielia litorea]|uniref:Zn-binding Pro-Ala-Ala-Arg (PAAR) domain-containing protein, incolved in TypeVI secretion n=1 Tax=Vannielia litorea TaxID=1217970 RepID=A0A1N6F8G8_9RHOB|nr:PAAR domain-containing protein [Vannielia litorea]SIN91582.1 Zn-binding Pro-Ala-Ala-Arg (PAAR) domain-containing protein, incolved in TypeVI secretion [Vannielia litorea]
MVFAARLLDFHACPMVTPGVPPIPHVGGPILPTCSINVITCNMPQARQTDKAFCVGPPDIIVFGSPTVLVNNLPAARMGDPCSHGGAITSGCPTVHIGLVYVPGTMLQSAAMGVNPSGSVVNCGNSIDAVLDRLDGTDPNAVAPATRDGLFSDIEARHGTTLGWNSSFQDAFDAVQAGGPGTRAIVGIRYSGGGSHVVVMANDGGTVGIVESQDWGPGNRREVITDAGRANTRYNGDGGSNVGWGIVP